MRILACDTSNSTCCAGVYDDMKPLAYELSMEQKTHSETFMPLVDRIMHEAGIGFDSIDCFAVTTGPGSFTGVRIGVSAVKGMAYASDKPCIEGSTLQSMAYNFLGSHAVICACMDARRSQVYNALFRVNGDEIERLCDDRAIAIEDLLPELQALNDEIILVGDGAELVFGNTDNASVRLAAPQLRYQRASSVAMAALEKYNRGESVTPAALMPRYLRLSQAERERNAKKEKEGNET